MDNIYNAELINNQINWLDKKPTQLNKNRKYKIKVILIENENLNLSGQSMINFFRNSPLFGIELDFQRSKDFGREIEL